MLTALKRGAVLAGIVGVGLLAVSNFSSAGQGPNIGPNYGSLRRACLDNEITVPGCLMVADYLQSYIRPTQGTLQVLMKDWRVLVLTPWKIFSDLGYGPAKECPECLETLQVFDSLLAQNATVAAIADSMEQACAEDYSDFGAQQQCYQFVDQYVPEVVEYIVKEEPPQLVCTELSYCGIN